MPRTDRDPVNPDDVQLAAALRDRIAAGEWPPGAHLPDAFDLPREYAVSRRIVYRALTILRTDGLVHGMHGQVSVNRERIPILYPAEIRVLLQVTRACQEAGAVPGDDGTLLAQIREVLNSSRG